MSSKNLFCLHLIYEINFIFERQNILLEKCENPWSNILQRLCKFKSDA